MKSTRISKTNLQLEALVCENWNLKHPIGTPVSYYPVEGLDRHIDTRTRSVAWTLGHGAAVVKVEGITGCVAISNHIELRVEGAEDV